MNFGLRSLLRLRISRWIVVLLGFFGVLHIVFGVHLFVSNHNHAVDFNERRANFLRSRLTRNLSSGIGGLSLKKDESKFLPRGHHQRHVPHQIIRRDHDIFKYITLTEKKANAEAFAGATTQKGKPIAITRKIKKRPFRLSKFNPEIARKGLEREQAIITRDFTQLNKFRQNHGFENLTLANLTLAGGGKPVQSLIIASWRTGSTFLSELLQSHVATFLHMEPLSHFGVQQIRTGPLAEEGLRVVSNLLDCNYTGIDNYLNYTRHNNWIIQHNVHLLKYCRKNYKGICWHAQFISELCRAFPFHVMKTVRLRLSLVNQLLEMKRDLRILLLIRDPRGVMQSRGHREWCTRPDCNVSRLFCQDLVDDFKAGVVLRKKYPDRFLALRYEEIALYPLEAGKKIIKFFRMTYLPKVSGFIRSHTNKFRKGLASTYRVSKATAFHWRDDFVGNFSRVKDIQKVCTLAMSHWGYKTVKRESRLQVFNPLGKPPWVEMVVNTKAFEKDDFIFKTNKSRTSIKSSAPEISPDVPVLLNSAAVANKL